jgi:hypothetical protein
VEDGAGCGAGGSHAARRPERVGFGEEAGDLAPAGSFAGLARFADENDEEIEAVTGGTDAAVRGGTDEVAEGRQELEEDGGGIGLSMWGKCTDEETGYTVEGGGVQCGWWGHGGSGWKNHRWLRFFFGVGFLEFVVFLRLFVLLRKRELLRDVGLFGAELVGCGESLRGLLAGLVSKQLSTPFFYGAECWRRAGRVEWVLSECHGMNSYGSD